jgi:serine/threonine-protein kinase
MGRVYEGICVNEMTHETRQVAVKFMFEDLPNDSIERARREASIRIKNEYLIEMIGFLEVREFSESRSVVHYHVVSELLQGVSLSDFLNGKNTDYRGKEVEFVKRCREEYSTDPESFARRVVRNVLSGLIALHDAGYIHRDIDPSNIMLTSDGHIKLIDFGIAKKIDVIQDSINKNDVTRIGSIVGKPKYAAPEICIGDIAHQNVTTDIYAVGILLFQLICGHVPFDGSANDIIQMQLKNKLPVNEIRNPSLRAVVRRATEKQQKKRYQSALEFRSSLDKSGHFTQKYVIVFAVIAVIGLIVGSLIQILWGN